MNERILEIRKNAGLTQEEFALKIGLSRNFIWMIEKGDRVPSDRTIADICRELLVSEVWLRTGEGEMFLDLGEDEEFLMVMEEINMSDDHLIREIITAYWHMPDSEKAVLRKLVENILEMHKEKTGL